MTTTTSPLPVDMPGIRKRRRKTPEANVLGKERWEAIAGHLSRVGWSVKWCQFRWTAGSKGWQAHAGKDGVHHCVTASDLTTAFVALEGSIQRT